MAKPSDLPDRAHFEAMPCGSRAKYIGARCRCMLCRAANSRYQSARALAIKAGDGNPLVSAGAARGHLRKLSQLGVGKRAVHEASDVALSVICDIRSGAKVQIRRQTERKILAVTVEAIADHGIVKAGRTHRFLGDLLAEGFTKAELARRLGSKSKTPALQLKADRVIAKNAAKVERIWQLEIGEASA